MIHVHSNCNIPIQVEGKIVGVVYRGTFVKKVRGSRHMLRRPRGWALDVSSLEEAQKMGAKSVEIHDLDSGLVYRASVADIQTKGILINRGFGDQLLVELPLWTIEEPCSAGGVR